ncbi:DNA sulfur modification protein DndB [Aeromonas veronii]|uniref:DNA sulfur modification protein DndB n=1 Tax=Aeromonas veronii TaxID=654 RepID=UPI001F331033|nr:DNA sulfur modification protein DndB [Aeromonas veronii]MCF5728829.1 DNA sulfur modification protein DndB [Aeromonas veronii]
MNAKVETTTLYANITDLFEILKDFNKAKVRLVGRGATKDVMGWSRTASEHVCFGSVTGRTTEQSLRMHLSNLLNEDIDHLKQEVAHKGYDAVLSTVKANLLVFKGQAKHTALGQLDELQSKSFMEAVGALPQPTEGVSEANAPKEAEAKGDEWVFNVPALRGLQGGRAYYAVTMPYRVLARLLQIQTGFAAIERAQREVNKSRVTDLVDYMGQAGYALPALTGCVEGKAEFTGDHMGTLAIDMGAKILLADGQHRASAIVNKVEADAALAGESVIIQLYTGLTLDERQQLFSDLNSKAVKPNASINNLYNHRKDGSQVARAVANAVFPGLIDFERTTCGGRSEFLYPFKTLIDANNVLMNKRDGEAWQEEEKVDALKIWALIMKRVPVTTAAGSGGNVAKLREGSVLGTAVGLMVLVWVAKVLMEQEGLNGLTHLRKADWDKGWFGWQGNVMLGAKMIKNGGSIKDGARAVLSLLDMPVTGVSGN